MTTDTARQQPEVFELSLASWTATGIECDWFAGHSLGSYSALVAGGALALEAGARIVAERGAAMAAAGEIAAGSMVALLGCDLALADDLAARYGLTVANDNAPGQVVLSGAVAAIDALERARPEVADGAAGSRPLRLRRLAVSGAFHSPLMRPAAERLALALAEAEFGDAGRVVANGTARPFVDPRVELAGELLAPVRWRETLLYLWERGVREFVEFEPSGVLTGLVKRTLPDAAAVKCGQLTGAVAGSDA